MIAKLARTVADHLREQPILLALISINLLFLIGFTFMLREISQATERKDAMIERCLNARP